MVPPTIKMGLPISMNIIKIFPHKLAQEILDSAKLTINISDCVCKGISREVWLEGKTLHECEWQHPKGQDPKVNERKQRRKQVEQQQQQHPPPRPLSSPPLLFLLSSLLLLYLHFTTQSIQAPPLIPACVDFWQSPKRHSGTARRLSR